jgi:hypothetical protein
VIYRENGMKQNTQESTDIFSESVSKKEQFVKVKDDLILHQLSHLINRVEGLEMQLIGQTQFLRKMASMLHR